MPSLTDIAPAVETVTIGGVGIEVRGVGIDAIAAVLSASPELAALLRPGAAGLDATRLLVEAPTAMYALMAAATGGAGNAEQIEAARRLTFGAQVDLLDAIIRLSMPGGLLPLVARLVAMLGQDAPAGRDATRASDTTGQPALMN
jgi:hypothetical protein